MVWVMLYSAECDIGGALAIHPGPAVLSKGLDGSRESFLICGESVAAKAVERFNV